MEFFYLSSLITWGGPLGGERPLGKAFKCLQVFSLFSLFPFKFFPSYLKMLAGLFLLFSNRSFSFFKHLSEICTQCLKEEVGVLLVIFINFQEQA